VAPVKKLREVFVLQPVMRKNLSQIFKIRLHLPRISSGKRRAEQAKIGKKMKKAVFFRDGWYSGPPLRW
jgi:hypothetical protein